MTGADMTYVAGALGIAVSLILVVALGRWVFVLVDRWMDS